jgi:pyruvate, water dikinase
VLLGEQDVTVSCAEGEIGFVYEGFANYEAKELDLTGIPKTRHR